MTNYLNILQIYFFIIYVQEKKVQSSILFFNYTWAY